MDIYQTRIMLKSTGKSLSDVPLRVVYYARVSTEKDEQINSLNNQQDYYESFISKNSNWELVGRYIDEGLSAITTSKRENFHQMINDAKDDKFDFVITKEISRFARNTLDSIQYTRELLKNGVAVWFQQDSINTIDDDSEMRLAIMSSLAQEESRKLSSRIRFGHNQSINNGVVMGNSKIYGYEKDNGKLVINEKEAEMVKLIFKLYATGDYSTPKIENILYEKGYRNFNGDRIGRNVLKNIIRNPKYKGYYCGNKVKVIDMFTKKQKFLDQSEWRIYKDFDTVPPIVDEGLWDKANGILEMRGNAIKTRRTSYKTGNLFTGKIICAEHNTPFYMKVRKAREKEDNPTWVCSHRIKNGKDSCKTYGIKENELVKILKEVLKDLSSNIDEVVDRYLQLLKEAQSKSNFQSEIKKFEIEINKILQKKDRLLELNIEGRLSNIEFEKRNNIYNQELQQKEKELENLKKEQIKSQDKKKDIFNLKDLIIRYHKHEDINLTSGVINSFIDKIYVEAIDETLNLKIVLNTGEIKGKSLGFYEHTSKKMIEAQERQMAGKTSTGTTPLNTPS